MRENGREEKGGREGETEREGERGEGPKKEKQKVEGTRGERGKRFYIKHCPPQKNKHLNRILRLGERAIYFLFFRVLFFLRALEPEMNIPQYNGFIYYFL